MFVLSKEYNGLKRFEGSRLLEAEENVDLGKLKWMTSTLEKVTGRSRVVSGVESSRHSW